MDGTREAIDPPTDAAPEARSAFDRRLAELRPKLHRYCARMTGSVIDGEDVVQEAMLKALEAFRKTVRLPIPRPGCFASPTTRRWIFLRRRARQDANREDPDMIVDPNAGRPPPGRGGEPAHLHAPAAGAAKAASS